MQGKIVLVLGQFLLLIPLNPQKSSELNVLIFQASMGSTTDKGYIVSIYSLRYFCLSFSSLFCPFIKILALLWLAWLFVHNNQQWFAHLEPWAFMWNFLSCFKVLLSFCQVVPSSPPSPMLQKISSQSNNSPDKFNIAPHHQHC